MDHALKKLFGIFWSSFSLGTHVIGLWYFVVLNHAQVGDYLCTWLLLQQCLYYFIVLASDISFSRLDTIARHIFPLNFAMSCVVTYVTMSSRDGIQELFKLHNFLLHIAPTLVNCIHVFLKDWNHSAEHSKRFLTTDIWDVSFPVVVLLFYCYQFDLTKVYHTWPGIRIGPALVVSVLSSLLFIYATRY